MKANTAISAVVFGENSMKYKQKQLESWYFNKMVLQNTLRSDISAMKYHD